MAILGTILSITNFRNPLLRTIVPSVAAAVALQAAVAIPSAAFKTERFYDLSGSLTYLAVGALSLYLPSLRARATAGAATGTLGSALPGKIPSLLAPFRAVVGGAGSVSVLNWRQVLLTGAVYLWAIRREFLHLTRRNAATVRTNNPSQSAHISSSASLPMAKTPASTRSKSRPSSLVAPSWPKLPGSRSA